MKPISERLKDTCHIGASSTEWVVDCMFVPAMRQLGMQFCGITAATQGFFFSRHKPEMAQLLCSCSGFGRVLVNGRWEHLRAGMAYATPPHVLRSYHALRKIPWQVCWVVYAESAGPVIPFALPKLLRGNPQYLQWAILGLYGECTGPADPEVMAHWVRLIHTHVGRFVGSPLGPDPLYDLWEAVNSGPARPWTLQELAGLACMSDERLRQLCHKYYGHSPLEHVASIRMRKASALLLRGDEKLEKIAKSLGYENAFTFSRAFKRSMGMSPSAFRAARAGDRSDTAAGRTP